jgi:threonine synthase
MKLVSTRSERNYVSFREAVLNPLPKDGGLYIPEVLSPISYSFITYLKNCSNYEQCVFILNWLLENEFSENELEILAGSISKIPIKTHSLNDKIDIIELWHGPSGSFKDFGAQFLSSLYKLLDFGKSPLLIVVTTGDTGAAIAEAFKNNNLIDVWILYPKSQISKYQENQLYVDAKNIHVVAVEGDFSLCQAIRNACFADNDINDKYCLLSANSINIARIIAQVIYHLSIYLSFDKDPAALYNIPSGNLGNFCSAIIANQLYSAVDKFIVANNSNAAFYNYYYESNEKYVKTKNTLASAMDIIKPSNLERIEFMLGSTWNIMRNDIVAKVSGNKQILKTINNVHRNYNYLSDPHTSSALLHALKKKTNNKHYVISTANPNKFPELIPNVSISNNKQELKSKTNKLRIINKFESLKEMIVV